MKGILGSDLIQQAVRDALIAFMAAMAGYRHERGSVGWNCRHKAKGQVYRDRKPSFDRKQLDIVTRMLSDVAGASAMTKVTGLSRQAVLRVREGGLRRSGRLKSGAYEPQQPVPAKVQSVADQAKT